MSGTIRAEATLDEGGNLVAPEIAGVGKPVQQDDWCSRPLNPDMELKPVGPDQLGLDLSFPGRTNPTVGSDTSTATRSRPRCRSRWPPTRSSGRTHRCRAAASDR